MKRQVLAIGWAVIILACFVVVWELATRYAGADPVATLLWLILGYLVTQTQLTQADR